MNLLKSILAISVVFATTLTSQTNATEMKVGGDRDANGCIASAGYSYDAGLGKCARSWEEKSSQLIVAPKKVACMGVAPMECLQVKGENGKWEYFYNSIEGFSYEPGYTYVLSVSEKHIENPPADGSSIEYKLLKIVSKKALRNTVWDVVSLNGKKIESFGRLAFVKDEIQGKFCNRMSGSYSIDGNTIKSPGLVSTMMFCSSDNMQAESALDLNGATWKLAGAELTITTKNKDVLVWKQR